VIVPVGLHDTGPLVSFLAAGLEHHEWATEESKRLRLPLLTCEHDTDPLFALLDRGVIQIGLSVQEQQGDLRALMRRYRNRPMSLAHACLVRLSEIHAAAEVLTLNSDVRIYRRHGNKVIPLRIPE
jgi:uncharacterized protein